VKTAVIILGHGSKNAGAGDALRRLVAEVKKLGGHDVVEHAFLQYGKPTLEDALEHSARQKAGRIVVVPFFMQSGTHVTKGIPGLVNRARRRYPGIEIVVTDYAGGHPLMAKIVLDLVEKTR
jgi:sirohydrochlorin ferrochelatase